MSYKKITGIYKITSPTGKIYVGQAISIYARWSSYRGLFCDTQRHLYNSFKKYGVDKHKFEIIHILETNNLSKSEIVSELNKLEIHYVSLFNSYVGNNPEFGLNLTRGGDFNEISEEGKERIRKSKLGIPRSEETKRKVSESKKGTMCGELNSFYGKSHSDEVKSTMNKDKKINFLGKNNPFYNKKHKEETLEKMRKPKSEEHKQKLRKPKSEQAIKNNKEAQIRYWENIRQERALMIF